MRWGWRWGWGGVSNGVCQARWWDGILLQGPAGAVVGNFRRTIVHQLAPGAGRLVQKETAHCS